MEEREEGDGSALMQMVMKPEQVSLADERFGRMLVALQKALENSGDKASGRAKALLYTVIQGRWTCRHAFTGARDSRFRTLEALLATFGASRGRRSCHLLFVVVRVLVGGFNGRQGMDGE